MDKWLPEKCWADSKINKIVIVTSSWSFILFTYIDDARSNTNQIKSNQMSPSSSRGQGILGTICRSKYLDILEDLNLQQHHGESFTSIEFCSVCLSWSIPELSSSFSGFGQVVSHGITILNFWAWKYRIALPVGSSWVDYRSLFCLRPVATLSQERCGFTLDSGWWTKYITYDSSVICYNENLVELNYYSFFTFLSVSWVSVTFILKINAKSWISYSSKPVQNWLVWHCVAWV